MVYYQHLLDQLIKKLEQEVSVEDFNRCVELLDEEMSFLNKYYGRIYENTDENLREYVFSVIQKMHGNPEITETMTLFRELVSSDSKKTIRNPYTCKTKHFFIRWDYPMTLESRYKIDYKENLGWEKVIKEGIIAHYFFKDRREHFFDKFPKSITKYFRAFFDEYEILYKKYY